MSPALPLIGGGNTRFQPVFAGDVGEAIARAVDGEARRGAIYELGGPEVLTFRQCMERVLEVTQRKRLLVPVPWGMARLIGRVGQFMPGAPITLDQVRMLQFDNVVSADAERDKRTLDGLGIDPTALEVVLPTYLDAFPRAGASSRRCAPHFSGHRPAVALPLSSFPDLIRAFMPHRLRNKPPRRNPVPVQARQ